MLCVNWLEPLSIAMWNFILVICFKLLSVGVWILLSEFAGAKWLGQTFCFYCVYGYWENHKQVRESVSTEWKLSLDRDVLRVSLDPRRWCFKRNRRVPLQTCYCHGMTFVSLWVWSCTYCFGLNRTTKWCYCRDHLDLASLERLQLT